MARNHKQLRAEGLYKQYGNRWVVSDVDIEVKKGEIIGLLGPNGAGKTTTFYMITGMINPSKGNIFLDDRKITSEAMYMRARSGIGYLAQEPSIFGKLTVENNLRLVLEMTGLTKNEQNEIISKNDITFLRPSPKYSIEPFRVNDLLGLKSKRKIKKGEHFRIDDL